MLISGDMKKLYDVFSIAKGELFMVKAADIGSLIVLDRTYGGGRPRISGTGVTVRRIVEWYMLGSSSPEEIAHEIGQITLAQVFAALAYYHAKLGRDRSRSCQ